MSDDLKAFLGALTAAPHHLLPAGRGDELLTTAHCRKVAGFLLALSGVRLALGRVTVCC